jgi:hypothetical protein
MSSSEVMATAAPIQANGITVVIPCLNEAESIGDAVDWAWAGIRKMGLPGEVVVVDNGSTDGSKDIADKHGARVIVEYERGYGAALRRGFASATYDVMVMGDGDLTYDFRELRVLVEPILDGSAEFVVGNRMRNIRPGAMPGLHRYVGNPGLSLLLRLMFHAHVVRDAHCGMRAITKDAYRRLRCVTTGMEFASEMIVRALHQKIRMDEREIAYHPRVGESKLSSFRDGWRHLRFMLLHSPSSALLLPGVVTWLLGVLIVLPLAFGPIVIRGRAIDIHCMIMGGLLNTVSIQVIMMGLLAKAYAHLSGLRHDPFVAWLYHRLTFEKLVLATLPLVLLGVVVILKVVIQWVASGFGALDETRLLFLGMLCFINGVQIASSGYLFSIMALPRHVDAFPAAPGDGKLE